MTAKIPLTWAILISAVVFIGCSGEKTANEYMADARSHMESGDIKSALIETRNAVGKAPDDRAARLLLGNLELQQGNPSGAEGALLKAMELGTPKNEVSAVLAEALFLQGKYEEVEKIDTNPLSEKDKASVLGFQSEVALAHGDLTNARALAENALKADATSAVALTTNARLQVSENNNPEARTYLSQALDETPGFSSAWELLGDIETSEQRLPEAIDAYSQAFKTSKSRVSPLYKRARTHLVLNDYESAAIDVEIFKKSNVKLPAVNLLEAELLLRQGKLSEAQLALEKSMKTAPDYTPAVRTLAMTHMLRGNLGQAEQFGKQFLDITDSDDSRVLLATIRLQAERFDQAEQTLLPLTESGRLNILASQVLATTQLKLGNFDDAVNTMLSLKANLEKSDSNESQPLAMLSSPIDRIGVQFFEKASTDGSASSETDYLTEQELLVVETAEALGANEFDNALEIAKTLFEAEPDNADVLTILARVQARSGDKDGAMKSLTSAIELNDELGAAVIYAAVLKADTGDVVDAQLYLEDALKRARGADRERLLLAIAALDSASGNEEQFISRLRQVHTENPSSYQPSVVLANYYSNQSDPENVLKVLSEISSTGRKNPTVVELQAQAHISLRQFDEAIMLLTPMVQIETQNAQWSFLRAKAYAGKNNIEAVNRDLEVALRIDPDYVPAKLAKVNFSIMNNDLQKAETQISQLETLLPGSDVLAQLTGRVDTVRQRNVQAESALESNKPPTSTSETMERARQHWANGDQERAIETLVTWLESNPEDVTIGLTLANSYTNINQTQNAIDSFKSVLEVDQNNFIALNNLAWQLRANDPTLAISYANRAVTLQPDNPATLDTLAVIQLERGMLTEAEKTFEKIRELQPTNPSILFNGARIKAALQRNEEAKEILKPLISGATEFPEIEAARALYNEL